MKKIMKKILGLSLLSSLNTLAATAIVGAAPVGGFAISVNAIFEDGRAYIQLGLLVAAVYGGYKLFIADDKSVLNWFLFGAGAGGIGAYDTIAALIINFVNVTP